MDSKDSTAFGGPNAAFARRNTSDVFIPANTNRSVVATFQAIPRGRYVLLARVPVKNIGSAVGTIICGPPVNTSGFFDEVISIDLGPGERDIIPLLGAGEARGNPIEIGCGAGSTTDFLVRNAHLVVLSVDN